jgi:hypothetical protein
VKFLAAGLAAGERCLAFTFDESREQVRRNSAGWGIDLDTPEESGLLRVVCDYPEVASLEDHFIRIRRAIEEHEPDRLVIDTHRRIVAASADGIVAAASSIDTAGVRPVPGRVPVLEIIVGRLADIKTKPGEIQVSCSPALTVIADRAEFSMMLASYLDNALAYAGPPIEIQAAEREGYAEIRVIDHGPGVPVSFTPHLFERFTRAPGIERKAEGTGLGLWIVRIFPRERR